MLNMQHAQEKRCAFIVSVRISVENIKSSKPEIRSEDNTIIPNYSQQDATFLYLFIFTDALCVSGGSPAHHQEHTTVHTASGIVNQYCC